MTREIIPAVSLTPHQVLLRFACLADASCRAVLRNKKEKPPQAEFVVISNFCSLFFASRPKAALGDIAQATVMVHVLIGTQKFSFFSLSYLNEESGDSSESFVLQMTHCPQLHLV
jgi:hypothetical protein